MAVLRDKLSGTDANGSSLTSLAAHPTLSVIHTVPDKETHTIWLSITNTNAGTVEVLGDMGEIANNWNHVLAAESTTNFGPYTLVGPTTLELGAVANGSSVKVGGSVERFRSTK